MVTGDQIVAHLVGDFVLQSDWMATEKSKKALATLAHASCYVLPFLLLTTNMLSLAIIGGTHFLIDHFKLARVVIWVRNLPWPGRKSWRECCENQFAAGIPPFMSAWLLVIVDNTMHILVNGAAIKYIG